MTYDQFYGGNPLLTRSYYQAHLYSVREENEKLWLQGVYFHRALVSVVTSALGGQKKGTEYPREPLDILPGNGRPTEDDIREERQRIIDRLSAFGKQFNNKG